MIAFGTMSNTKDFCAGDRPGNDGATQGGGRWFVRVGGMHCEHCVEAVQCALRAVEGVETVRLSGHVAEVSPEVDRAKIVEAIRDAGYDTRLDWITETPPRGRAWIGLATAAAMAVAWQGLRKVAGIYPFDVFPSAGEAASLGALFVVGLLTSLHCAGMCGGFALSATLGARSASQTRDAGDAVGQQNGRLGNWMPALLYNVGRIGVYALIGAAAGALGAAISPGPRIRGALQLVAGIAMILFALRQLGIIDIPGLGAWNGRRHLRLPPRTALVRPLLIGAANGLMPCGPLQAVQLWALGSGSAARGALALLCFGLGTAPLLFAFAAGASLLARRRALVATLAGALVLLLGIGMARRGIVALRVAAPVRAEQEADASGAWLLATEGEDGVQIVRFDLEWDRYPDIAVEAGRPVRLIVHAEADRITGCNNEFSCPALGLHAKLAQGDNVAEFLPAAPGLYSYSCWMDMLSARILVKAADGETAPAEAKSQFIELTPDDGGIVAVPLGRVTSRALFVNVPKEGEPTVQLLAIRDGEGRARIAFNTCQACSPSPRAFFVQSDDGRLVCQNCGNAFGPEAVGSAARGCNPAAIPGVSATDAAIVVPAASIDAARGAFTRWAGPRE